MDKNLIYNKEVFRNQVILSSLPPVDNDKHPYLYWIHVDENDFDDWTVYLNMGDKWEKKRK